MTDAEVFQAAVDAEGDEYLAAEAALLGSGPPRRRSSRTTRSPACWPAS